MVAVMRLKAKNSTEMSPEVAECHSLVSLESSFSPPSPSPLQQPYPSVSFKSSRGSKSMSFTRNKIILVLVLVLSSLSILRLVRIALTTSYTSPLLAIALPPKLQRQSGFSRDQSRTSANEATISEKEFKLLSNLIAKKAPCNLLFFGLESQYVNLSAINDGGKNVFLEDDPYKLSTFKIKSNHTRMYKVDYKHHAEKAYKLLKHARGNKACAPNSELRNSSKCQLALTDLPREVYKVKWDVVVVDGPRGDSLRAPGRMATIYSAAIIARVAREGNTTDVVVHDIDRMIEKWYSWEFLCDENLISSKGKLWIFRIRNEKKSTRFCHDKSIVIQ